MLLYIIILFVVLIIIYSLILYNSFIKLNNEVDEAFSTMDVYLKKRWDLIPNLLETVKGYTKYEKDSLKEIIELRNNTYDMMSNNEKIKANENISNEISKIMLLKENYPKIKANENFKDLSEQLKKIEKDIANSRKYYNAVVRIYNNKVETFPNNIFAKIFGYNSKIMFSINDIEKDNIKIKL